MNKDAKPKDLWRNWNTERRCRIEDLAESNGDLTCSNRCCRLVNEEEEHVAYVYTRTSNRHTTPPTHTGALSYSLECVRDVFTEEVFFDSVREWLLHRPGVVVIHRLDLLRVLYPSNGPDRGETWDAHAQRKTAQFGFLISSKKTNDEKMHNIYSH